MDGLEVTVAPQPDRTVAAEVVALDDRVGAAGGRPLGGSERAALERLLQGAHGAADRAAVLARRGTTGSLAGYAPLATAPSSPGTFATELMVAPGPDATAIGDHLLDATVDAATDAAGRDRGRTLRLWVAAATAADDARAGSRGFTVERDLLQLRCPLPLALAHGDGRRGRPVGTRPFRPGADEEAWLAVNNRAFAGHPEQGHWDRATLEEREREAWFDPAGFLLHEEDGRLLAFCWTKVHPTARPPMGEIYVIGVDPDAHGRGLGRSLTVAGFDRLAGAGLSVGMLYVDAANTAAVSLYRSLGMVDHQVDRAYVRHLEPR